MKRFQLRVAATLSMFVMLTLLAGGCAGVGANKLSVDRFDYGLAIGNSLKSQTLLNIVKLRYLEWPTFLEVDQIATAYTMEHIASTRFINRRWFSGADDQLDLGYAGRFEERPTVLYRPLRGSRFVKSIMLPPRPSAIFALIQTGWPADMILRLTLQSVNGHMNTRTEFGIAHKKELAFTRFVKLIRRLQTAQALRLSLHKVEGEQRVTLSIHTELLDEETLRELKEVKTLIGLDPASNSYQVVWSNILPDRGILAVQTRSILQIMVALASYVDVPASDVESGRVARLKHLPAESEVGFQALIRIQTATSKPDDIDVHVTVPYRDRWFWIDDTDVNSKRTFAYMQMLLNITESGGEGGSQLLISTQ